MVKLGGSHNIDLIDMGSNLSTSGEKVHVYSREITTCTCTNSTDQWSNVDTWVKAWYWRLVLSEDRYSEFSVSRISKIQISCSLWFYKNLTFGKGSQKFKFHGYFCIFETEKITPHTWILQKLQKNMKFRKFKGQAIESW